MLCQEGRLCALDLLSVAGLLNYFGRAPENDNITVTPVLLQKGSTKLALYGLSNVRDERLFRTFRDGKVKFLRPDVQQKEWFNLICVHQNQYVAFSSSTRKSILLIFSDQSRPYRDWISPRELPPGILGYGDLGSRA